MNTDAKVIRAALESDCYRSFITNVIAASSKEGKRPNIAAVSRKAGFSSRSFIGDVIDGRRRLSASSYPKLARALPLAASLKTYFHLLVIKEEDELNLEKLKSSEIDRKIEELKSKLRSRIEQDTNENSNILLKGRDLMECHAALGNSKTGASLEDVCRKTELPNEVCFEVLKCLVDQKIAEKRSVDGIDRYFVINQLVFHKGLGGDSEVKRSYAHSVDELKRKSAAQFKSDERAFFHFVMSVDRKKMPELKLRLWDVMQEFMESSENTDGDAIAKLVVGLYV
ncbi:MAG: hypothetical protein V4692_15435 [Bdellovibrionota bacterium]